MSLISSICLICILTATTLIHLCSFDCTKIDMLPCAGHYVCKYQRKVRLWSCAPGVEQLPAGCMMGLKAVRQRDEGMEVRKVPLLGLGFLRAAQYPASLVALAIRCWNPGGGRGVPTRADRLRSQPAAIRGGRTSTGGSTVTQTSAHSQRVKNAATKPLTEPPHHPQQPQCCYSIHVTTGYTSKSNLITALTTLFND